MLVVVVANVVVVVNVVISAAGLGAVMDGGLGNNAQAAALVIWRYTSHFRLDSNTIATVGWSKPSAHLKYTLDWYGP